jgi:hypothetical protein
MDVVFIELHQHIGLFSNSFYPFAFFSRFRPGGVNISVMHYRNGSPLGVICAATPIYGTGTTPGNENGYGK